ncbi:MAG: MBL fold metallo-hydrolase [Verrucomicrobia bacterium]|nr:MBL fold metallo-hydrolase [Verrucomicrobiota bacterium]
MSEPGDGSRPVAQLLLEAPSGVPYRLESGSLRDDWRPRITFAGTGSNRVQLLEPAEVANPAGEFFRAVVVEDPLAVTGDHFATTDGDVVVHPVNHASFVLRWRDRMIYNDPVGGAARYSRLPRADLILVSHDHGDHFDTATLNAVRQEGTRIIAPAAVFSRMSAALRALTLPLANGAETNAFGIRIEAVPAYNANHPRGAGNGYVLTVGERRIYMSGDTGSTPEMRALADIDLAFLCMNVPFTMTIPDAVAAVRAFRPGIVYPYHFRNQGGGLADLAAFQRGVADLPEIEVRRRTWY